MCERELGTTFFDNLKRSDRSKNLKRPYCVDCRKKMNREYYLKRKEADDSRRVCEVQ